MGRFLTLEELKMTKEMDENLVKVWVCPIENLRYEKIKL